MNREEVRASKGQRTRQRIVEEAAVLFNTRGVAGASMADVSEATGLEKGGVYNHFATKEELSVAAFEYGASVVRERMKPAFTSDRSGLERLRAFLDIYRHRSDQPLIKGGCPIMNTAIESDDTNPELRRRARGAMEEWRSNIATALEDAIRAREIVTVESGKVASIFLATIEGGVMLAKLYGDGAHLRASVDHLDAYLDSVVLRGSRGKV